MNRAKKLIVLIVLMACATSHALGFNDPDYDWVVRKHIARYTLAINSYYSDLLAAAEKSNKQGENEKEKGFFSWQPLFGVIHPFTAERFAAEIKNMPKQEADRYLDFGFQVVEYARDGMVITPNKSSAPLRVLDVPFILNTIAQVLAAESWKPGDRRYFMGLWFYGSPEDKSSKFSPGLCDRDDISGRYSFPADWRMRYSVDRVARVEGKVGCREWAYQLKRPATLLGEGGFPPDAGGQCKSGEPPESLRDGSLVCGGKVRYKESDWQPYIDVTTRLGKKPPRIGNLLGWASFNDPVRPVIGQFGKYWLCFHECPDGEKPGAIENIGLWAARRGWPNPETRRLRFFGDSKYAPTPLDWED